jgi:hypothetical protein
MYYRAERTFELRIKLLGAGPEKRVRCPCMSDASIQTPTLRGFGCIGGRPTSFTVLRLPKEPLFGVVDSFNSS